MSLDRELLAETIRNALIAANGTGTGASLVTDAVGALLAEATEYSEPEAHAFIGKPGDVCGVCRYARGAAWHYTASAPRVLWEGEIRASYEGATDGYVAPPILPVAPGTRVLLIEAEST